MKTVEIYKVGLFPEYTGRQYGRYFLPAVFEELFRTNDNIYLNTRSTNHAGVIPFYNGLGMHVFAQETLPNDLLPKQGHVKKAA